MSLTHVLRIAKNVKNGTNGVTIVTMTKTECLKQSDMQWLYLLKCGIIEDHPKSYTHMCETVLSVFDMWFGERKVVFIEWYIYLQ